MAVAAWLGIASQPQINNVMSDWRFMERKYGLERYAGNVSLGLPKRQVGGVSKLLAL